MTQCVKLILEARKRRVMWVGRFVAIEPADSTGRQRRIMSGHVRRKRKEALEALTPAYVACAQDLADRESFGWKVYA